MPVKECQIVDYFLGPALKDEVMKIMPVQKQTRAGQRTRFKVGRHLPACMLACTHAMHARTLHPMHACEHVHCAVT